MPVRPQIVKGVSIKVSRPEMAKPIPYPNHLAVLVTPLNDERVVSVMWSLADVNRMGRIAPRPISWLRNNRVMTIVLSCILAMQKGIPMPRSVRAIPVGLTLRIPLFARKLPKDIIKATPTQTSPNHQTLPLVSWSIGAQSILIGAKAAEETIVVTIMKRSGGVDHAWLKIDRIGGSVWVGACLLPSSGSDRKRRNARIAAVNEQIPPQIQGKCRPKISAMILPPTAAGIVAIETTPVVLVIA